jgi:hypothetical protein
LGRNDKAAKERNSGRLRPESDRRSEHKDQDGGEKFIIYNHSWKVKSPWSGLCALGPTAIMYFLLFQTEHDYETETSK